eukprot:gnl/TRDRNA2_/TRDRNA2_91914_c0_seq1.p1 gnl/TRDRNA2_/TRDRNA2_91914_c0~~gnl/TRDRNA2_/TRDRNA2_91914_c0_seq1.p1  ORF type:complete len:351 (-),score=49.34 gnl/TRDRNA2_/TRDRNA2_91914_c0_seq1:53-1105(-)
MASPPLHCGQRVLAVEGHFQHDMLPSHRSCWQRRHAPRRPGAAVAAPPLTGPAARLPCGSFIQGAAVPDAARTAMRRLLRSTGSLEDFGLEIRHNAVRPDARLAPIASLGECHESWCGTCRLVQPQVRPGFVPFVAQQCLLWAAEAEEHRMLGPCVCSLGSGYLLLEWEIFEELLRHGIEPRAVHLIDPKYGTVRGMEALASFAAWFPNAAVISHESMEDYEAACDIDPRAAPDICLQLDCVNLHIVRDVRPMLRRRLRYDGFFVRLSPMGDGPDLENKVLDGGACAEVWRWRSDGGDVVQGNLLAFPPRGKDVPPGELTHMKIWTWEDYEKRLSRFRAKSSPKSAAVTA